MWGAAFEESMLDTCKNLTIHCPKEELAEDLMEIFQRNGIRWCEGSLPMARTYWREHESDTCYWVESKSLEYSSKQYAEETQMKNM